MYRVPGSEADSVDTLLEFVARLPNSQAPQVVLQCVGLFIAAGWEASPHRLDSRRWPV